MKLWRVLPTDRVHDRRSTGVTMLLVHLHGNLTSIWFTDLCESGWRVQYSSEINNKTLWQHFTAYFSLFMKWALRYDAAYNSHARVNWIASTKNKLIMRCANTANRSSFEILSLYKVRKRGGGGGVIFKPAFVSLG
jgi:hypothetical protein